MERIEIKEIIFLGPQGSWCEKAKSKFCRSFSLEKCKHKSFNTIRKVVEYVDEHRFAAGVVPIENSIEGNVRESLDSLFQMRDTTLSITSELILPINHSLISYSKSFDNIRHVISHPQAYAQCQKFLSKILRDDFEFIETSSTSKAVKDLEQYDNTYCAIAAPDCKKAQGMKILAKDINDEPDNKTRFVMISRRRTEPSGHDKTSIAFVTSNEAGALSKVLNLFSDEGINLSYINSRPSKKHLGDYVFFVDLEAHIEDKRTYETILKMGKLTHALKILGSYPIAAN